jgi:RNA polymerase subunit RPABC4/transcription elongation factor Spt4
MKQCRSCQGVVPASLDSCPNCAVSSRTRGGLKAVALGFVAIAVSNCSQMALYGAPCANACFTDGGAP